MQALPRLLPLAIAALAAAPTALSAEQPVLLSRTRRPATAPCRTERRILKSSVKVHVALCNSRCRTWKRLYLANQAAWDSNRTESRSWLAVRCTSESRAAARRRSCAFS